MSSRPMLTRREAATACAVSRTTIRRRREAGELPGAVRDEQRGWLIPVEDLLAAGFRLNAPANPAEPATTPAASGDVRGEQPSDVAGLRAELERERHERALAEAEHGRLLADQTSTDRSLDHEGCLPHPERRSGVSEVVGRRVGFFPAFGSVTPLPPPVPCRVPYENCADQACGDADRGPSGADNRIP